MGLPGTSALNPVRATHAAGTPPMARGPMRARPWLGFRAGLRAALHPGAGAHGADGPPPAYARAALGRRRMLLALIALTSIAASVVLAQAQRADTLAPLQWLQIGLFALLFGWVAAGFATALTGFVVRLRGDPHSLRLPAASDRLPDAPARTAIVMPICNEDVRTVFAGLRATVDSLAATGLPDLFDVYLLSDSSDPAVRAAEVAAWADLRRTAGVPDDARERIHYRWRRRRGERKAGNVADFCRRWGRRYRYMVVLDADSVMTGDCLLTLVRLMEAHPQVGILQTAPQPCGHDSLHARAQQFASRVTGSLFAAGMHYWQLGEAHYWGHNAIIRVAPFMRHCALAPLPGRGALSGEILSHDFVEAALMRRAGYQVWLLPDLAGSYEQPPPHLLAELQRDRRWCQGNLQNTRLLAEPGLHAVHRAMLAAGAMAYVSAPLWLLYVALGVLLWLLGGSVFVSADGSLAAGVLGLWAATFAMLALPRALGVAAILVRREQGAFGGGRRLVQGALLEAGLSVLQAPLRMVAHTLFVIGALSGWRLQWVSPPRRAAAVGWSDAARRFAPAGLGMAASAAALGAAHAPALPWLMPVALPLWLAVPMAVLTSRADLGLRLRHAGWLRVPEDPPAFAAQQPPWTSTQDQPAAPDLSPGQAAEAIRPAAPHDRGLFPTPAQAA